VGWRVDGYLPAKLVAALPSPASALPACSKRGGGDGAGVTEGDDDGEGRMGVEEVMGGGGPNTGRTTWVSGGRREVDCKHVGH
jgi:hypothetical protein